MDRHPLLILVNSAGWRPKAWEATKCHSLPLATSCSDIADRPLKTQSGGRVIRIIELGGTGALGTVERGCDVTYKTRPIYYSQSLIWREPDAPRISETTDC